MNSTTDSGRLSVREKFGYGLGDLASNFFWQMFAIFIAKFYTDVFMLGAATMGTMMLVTRVADAFFDPMIGTISDRTVTRWGHFRPYLVWMALPMAIFLPTTPRKLRPQGLQLCLARVWNAKESSAKSLFRITPERLRWF